MASMETDDPRPVGDDLPDFLRVIQERTAGMDLEDVHVPTPEEQAEEAEEERRQARVARAMDHWAQTCPPMYRDATLDAIAQDPDQHHAAAGARAWFAPGPLTFIIAGPVGTGKTHLAAAMGTLAASRARRASFVTVADLLEAMRPEGDRRAARQFRQVPFLVLDDLGATRASEFAVESLTALMDDRLRSEKRTVVTTNADAATLRESWGDRFADRLVHRAVPVILAGPSRRTTW